MTTTVNQTYSLRPAKSTDRQIIRQLIRTNQLNPLGLNWRRFQVAAAANGDIIGCGQMKPHRDGSIELASLAVDKTWQRQGVATTLIHELISNQENPVWLTCATNLVPFYEKYGFNNVTDPSAMPAYFRRVWHLFQLIRRIFRPPHNLAVMVHPTPSNF